MELIVLLDVTTTPATTSAARCSSFTAASGEQQHRRRWSGSSRSGRIGQSQVVLALTAHPVGIGRSVVPLDADPSIVAQVTDDTPLSRRIAVLLINKFQHFHFLPPESKMIINYYRYYY